MNQSKMFNFSNMEEALMSPVVHSGFQELDIIGKIENTEPQALREIRRLHSKGIYGMLAGGYVAFLLGLTDKYTDVDYFCEDIDRLYEHVSANSAEYTDKKCFKNGLPVTFEKLNFFVVDHKNSKLQVIAKRNTNNLSGYSYYADCLRSFDLPICKKAIFLFPIEKEYNEKVEYTNDSLRFIMQSVTKIKRSEQFLKSSRAVARQEKYNARLIHHGSPGTLKEICQDSVIYHSGRKQDYIDYDYNYNNNNYY
ncbi:hypothetical protein [Chrysodeixis includens nucleopolyhedrovirus]|uniref:Uncharacterized protein n=1 Tax=Chrysodeixis includens nucleopolyhedrovirus TaxID=1207438 RepID=A0A1C8ZY65_9ABAC|nr:hypothetical protein [Chrysodeixis includens nucleopolyhedrovirus]AOL56613.1 hypothetical protein [Chrysodeixis includens nucleopolyhedrovirus]AOL56754.1 hypothetical protein [Chrysodeixis includens nucleopolyhedrovirus]AOL56896.1 hypothetical protein [Chrysodeixis includens nucleopolyhedrovirus]